MGKFKKYGLIGYPLGYSFSPSYFKSKFKALGIKDASYKAYPIEQINSIKKLLPRDISGFNVTIPHKETIIPFLDEISKSAKRIQAVNTVKVVGDKWIGYNTDVYGFERSLKNLIGRRKIKEAMVLGNGGAAKAIKFVLKVMDIKVNVISRKRGYRGYNHLSKDFILKNLLIVNTTPLGTAPKIEEAPNIPYQYLTPRHLLYDLVYNPEKSLFLNKGELKNSSIKNGLEMLHLQAERSWEIWNETIKNNE